jgi:transcription antitermination factor NusG
MESVISSNSSVSASILSGQHDPTVPGEYSVERWYAAYTSANHEKRVSQHLSGRNIEHFLPLYSSIRRWQDRKVRLQVPLFPGYLFVKIALSDRRQVLQVPGVANLVSFRGIPAALSADEVESLRDKLATGVEAEPHPYLANGEKVTLQSGPLAGLTGILLRRKSRARLIVSVDLIQRSVAVEVDEADLAAAK